MRAILAIPVCALALAGCLTLDAEGCRSINWYDIGRRDGFAGGDSQLDQYAAKCTPHGSRPDAANYARGLEEARSERAQRRISLF